MLCLYEKKWLAKGDYESATEYPEYLKKLMEENGYLPEQVFKADEMVLFWKYVLTCTSVEDDKKTSSLKPRNDKLKDLLCSNVCGDY